VTVVGQHDDTVGEFISESLKMDRSETDQEVGSFIFAEGSVFLTPPARSKDDTAHAFRREAERWEQSRPAAVSDTAATIAAAPPLAKQELKHDMPHKKGRKSSKKSGKFILESSISNGGLFGYLLGRHRASQVDILPGWRMNNTWLHHEIMIEIKNQSISFYVTTFKTKIIYGQSL
jgi:hypothetical protein